MKNLIYSIFNPKNEFFLLTKNAKRLTHISLSSFILPILFLFIAGAIFQFALVPVVIDPYDFPRWVRLVFNLFALFGIGIILIFLWVRFFEGRTITSLGFAKNGWIKKYLNGFAIGLFMNSLVIGLIALFGGIEISSSDTNITGFNAIGIVALFLVGFIVQGASEEILSRGWMMQVIGARYVPWLGVLLSSILFAILHLGNAGINLSSVLNLIFFALFMTLLVLKDGSLWSACAWHSAWNWSLGNIFGLSVSGSGEKATIFDLNTVGNEYISGGGFGPEGSLITTIVLIAGIVILIIKVRQKSYPIEELDENKESESIEYTI